MLTDDKCDDGTLELITNDPDELFGPGEVWVYTCTATIPVDATGTFVNTADVCVPVPGEDELCDTDTTTVTIPPNPNPNPGIDLEKVAAVTEAPAGSPVEYTFAVTNTGDETYNDEDVVLTDTKCDAGTLERTQGDDQLAPDEVWTYKCTATTRDVTRPASSSKHRRGLGVPAEGRGGRAAATMGGTPTTRDDPAVRAS